MVALLPVTIISLFLAACALHSPPRFPETSETSGAPPQRAERVIPPPLPPAEPQIARLFPEFAAVIVQPGDSLASLAAKYLGDPSKDWIISEFNGVQTATPGQPLIIPFKPFENGGLTSRGYQTVPVIVYHKFSKDRMDLTTVSEKAFNEQMRFLKEGGYHVISMDDFFDFIDLKKQIPKKSVVITIDDGFRSVYDIAFPVLRKYGYPATFFIYTDLIVHGSKTLDWELLREMARHGISVQCHTKTHRYLDRQVGRENFKEYFEAVRRDIVDSTRIIKQRVNTDVKYLAYPYGETNHLLIALLAKLGYRGGFTVEREGNPFFVHPYRINRSMIYGTFDLKQFEKNLVTFSNNALR